MAGIVSESTLLLIANVLQAMFLAYLAHREIMAGKDRREVQRRLEEKDESRRDTLER